MSPHSLSCAYCKQSRNPLGLYAFETSWGITTRTIGGVIMTHGDNRGLVLPPKVAPIQVVVIPVAQHKEGVLSANEAVMERLQKAGFRVKMDASDNSPAGSSRSTR